MTILIFHFFPLDDDSMLYSMTKLAAKESDSKKTPKKKEDPKAKPEPIKKEHKSPKTAPIGGSSAPKNPPNNKPSSGTNSKTSTKEVPNKKKDSDLKSMFRLAIELRYEKSVK